jgi:hypothetical protein
MSAASVHNPILIDCREPKPNSETHQYAPVYNAIVLFFVCHRFFYFCTERRARDCLCISLCIGENTVRMLPPGLALSAKGFHLH